MQGCPPKLLFIAPCLPAFEGNGLAMRAGSLLKALGRSDYELFLLVIPIYPLPQREPSGEILKYCDDWAVVEPRDSSPKNYKAVENNYQTLPRTWRLAASEWVEDLPESLSKMRFELVFVFRFYMAPFCDPFRKDGARIILDMDEIDSTAFLKTSLLLEQNGKISEADSLRKEAEALSSLESTVVDSVDAVTISSGLEKANLQRKMQSQSITVLPNTIPKARTFRLRKPKEDFRFLFVGSFGHHPNWDAANRFCREYLPLIRSRSPLAVSVDIVGAGANHELEQLALLPDVRVHGRVSDLAAYYLRCHSVVVPLKAGGGTRIKILEAFQFGRPVVSTAVGAEGLEVENEVHLLVADDGESFVQACLKLVEDPSMKLHRFLTRNAAKFVRKEHPQGLIDRRMMGLLNELSKG